MTETSRFPFPPRLNRKPEFSVLINSYNYGRFVGRAVDSALAQTDASAEVIVVDDGSTDGTDMVLAPYADRVRIIRQANAGQAAAINTGVEASRGEFLCFLDADDWWHPGKLAAVGAAFRADPRTVLAYHRLQPVDGKGQPAFRPIPRSLCRGDLVPRMLRAAGWWPFPMTSSIAVRRSAWDEAGAIPGGFRLSADAWLVGVYPFLGRVAALPRALGFYRIHANGWYRAEDDAAMLRRRMEHWVASVEATNAFLIRRGSKQRIRLEDHYPYRVARLRLEGASAAQRLDLALRGLTFAGEPNLLRRLREVARGMPPLAGPQAECGEPAR